MDKEILIEKYNVPVPRYTSYPTVPFWGQDEADQKKWFEVVKQSFNESNSTTGISIYIHLPYCEKLCTYCACTKIITNKHSVEETYIDAVLDEWNIYLKEFDQEPIIRELPLGGGTPTFFSPENLTRLIKGITNKTTLHPDYEFSFEGHPNNTTREHLQALYNVGFRRVSYGVQDFDPEVQRIIDRIQTYEIVKEVSIAAREIGYTSVNYDLIYGLPLQKLSSVSDTFDKIAELKPDRIAYYSYAHVPWKTKGQRLFTEADIPDNAAKRELYELGKTKLEQLGYKDVGMDHFALEHDELYIARENNRLHRNFMGYNTSHTQLLIGLGASSISDAKYAYAQNAKSITPYKKTIALKKLDLVKTYFLSKEDLVIKQAILDITCKRKLIFKDELLSFLPADIFSQLKEMEDEKIITIETIDNKKTLIVSDLGMIFLRNISKIFDNKIRNSKNGNNMFSKSI